MNEDFKVVWIDRFGQRHDDDEYLPGQTAATFRAMEIVASHRAEIHRIWLQSREISL